MTGEAGHELHLFGCRTPSVSEAPAEVVGNKAANLIRMAAAGLPVPPGFVLPISLCHEFFANKDKLAATAAGLLRQGIQELEQPTGQVFGGSRRPLLVSVRSGAPMSMPGMLDTVLNIGLCERTLPALVRATGNPRHAWDCYRRLIQSHAEIVCAASPDPFDRALAECLRREAVPNIAELDVAALKQLAAEFLELHAAAGTPFPQEPTEQLTGAVEAVFRSWYSPRAVEYRRLNKLNDHAGTAVTVQSMVFGNMSGTSGSGVGFTRNPATGENELYLDFLWNAQGEDVVSGRCEVESAAALRATTPHLLERLREVAARLEALFRDAQDFEFTVQEDRLYLLQTRAAKRTQLAALRIACEQVAEGLIDEATGLTRLSHCDLGSISTVRVSRTAGTREAGAGTPASPGVAVGEAVFDPQRATSTAATGRAVILVRGDISTDDIAALATATGILTARGGRTSHASVVARQLNKVCVVGCRELKIEPDGRRCRIGDELVQEGDTLSLDGHTGQVFVGALDVSREVPTALLAEVEGWKSRTSCTPSSARSNET